MFTLPDLPYPANALEPHIDAQTMEIHHGKHHAAYIKNLNEALANKPELVSLPVDQLISDLSRLPEEIRTQVKNNGGGHANHSLFWQVMAPAGSGGEPEGKLLETIKTSFGNVDTFKEKFSSAAMGRFGSGWAWLVVAGGKLAVMGTPNQDSPLMEKLTPILGLDVWEHAYYLKYQNRRAEYIEAWWNIVNWKKVEELFLESSA